ncbi:hypothetical protein BCR32DRAFT_236039 [Anaeromyces robustus]|uniref:Sugar transporter SWEET1 n=1 Tax=Anaeromyces robustus TaxID=1754192 RepID=A0A1Y1WUH4_9FUNG|nr:hypothetical protein BCR32DRAFT_236039 [Anaeromyces robustus]|eukprot:ORX77055.1 hypothetical protein BCR32DRAFT_236039 [Anaeromyces robustus]
MECSSKVCEIITETIFPIGGIGTSYFIFLSPLKDIQALKNSNGPCTINPIPSVMIICNCLCWNLYSFVIHNHWTFWPNLGGILLGEYYVMILLSSKITPKDFKMSVITLLGFTFLNIAGGALSFIFLKDNYTAAKNCMGIVCIIVLCAMYASPLTTMAEVIRTKNSDSINLLMTIASFINGFLWLIYGIFFQDFYVWFPNGLGVVSALIQFIMYFAFHKNSKRDSQDLPIYDNNSGEASPNSEIPSSPDSNTPIKGNSTMLYS